VSFTGDALVVCLAPLVLPDSQIWRNSLERRQNNPRFKLTQLNGKEFHTSDWPVVDYGLSPFSAQRFWGDSDWSLS
jgi:hypothetical protein